MTPTLTLGLVGLSDPECALVATLFRLHRVEPSFIWTLVDSGPVDALLVDASMLQEDFADRMGACTQVMRLSPHGGEREGQMSRPIRSDRLVAWLNSVELERLQQAPVRSAQAEAPPPAAPAAVVARQDAPVAIAMPEANGYDGPAWRLRRWPAPALLGKDAIRIRLATMLSRRAMSLPELASLARVPLAHCQQFVTELQRQGLIDILPSSPTTVVPRPEARAATAVTSTRRGVGASLIHSIRRRFGFA
ncbi:MAG: hypothetical protein LT081_00640 [Hydrogenophaga sp.]|nr:hypothetical protein [Hydrogenophaga sp.]